MATPCDPAAVRAFDYSRLHPDLTTISKPAQRALLNHAVTRPAELAKFRQQDVLSWHGIGPTAMPKLSAALRKHGLQFAP